jgi:DNA polymerase (family X)
MQNEQIADVFDEMADLLEIAGESSFRVRAYRNGSQVIRNLAESVSDWIASGKDLTSLDGIGDTLAEKSKVLVLQGELPQLTKLRAEVPPSLRALLRIPGLGAKKVAVLFKELSVQNLSELRAVCEANLVQGLKGFGVKTQQAILDGLKIAEQANARLSRDQSDPLVERLRDYLAQCPAIQRFDFAGSYRRGKETVGDIDILVVSQNPAEVMSHFVACPIAQQTIAQGATKSSIRVNDAFQVDLRVVAEESWGAALQYFTGSKEHNVVLRGIAKKLGYRLNEYGLFASDDESKLIASREEVDIYRVLGLPFIPPEFRENRHEWREDFAEFLPEAVSLKDIHGDLHMHTTATDGENSIEEMVEAAKQLGLEYIAITDHSQRVSMARGLTSKRLLEQWAVIDELNDKLRREGFLILKGIECDILENGQMDLPDEVLEQADWVTASIHYGQKQPREEITQRILNALRHPSVTAISHPTGRLLGRREAYAVDLDSMFDEAAKLGKFLEINANPWRLDLSDIHCMAAAAKGCQFVINTDAHSISNLGLMKYGLQVARRAGLKRSQIFNTRTLTEIRDWRARKSRD